MKNGPRFYSFLASLHRIYDDGAKLLGNVLNLTDLLSKNLQG
jgi:hypothetical protein